VSAAALSATRYRETLDRQPRSMICRPLLLTCLLLDRANWVLLNVAKFFPLPQVRRFLDRLWVIPISAVSMVAAQMMIHETIVRNLWVWIVEFLKLAGRRRLYPVNAECPICRQMVRLHYKKAGRRHVLAHARACSRALYEGSRYAAHYTAKLKCLGSGMLAKFDPRPNEHQHFNTPKSL